MRRNSNGALKGRKGRGKKSGNTLNGSSSKKQKDWAKLYGLGKGLWKHEDAQAYVNRMREDRI